MARKSDVTVRPNDLVTKVLGPQNRVTGGKMLRGALRQHYPRDVMNASWHLSGETLAFAEAFLAAKRDGKAFDANAWKATRRKRAARKANAPKATSSNVTPSSGETI